MWYDMYKETGQPKRLTVDELRKTFPNDNCISVSYEGSALVMLDIGRDFTAAEKTALETRLGKSLEKA